MTTTPRPASTNIAAASALSRTAFHILTADLEAHGNVLSQLHRAALLELVDTFTAYCTGTASGRRAIALPTGMGKTSAVVAFVAAMFETGQVHPVAIAASRVEALCEIQRSLIAHGVPALAIGLKHTDVGASEPSTGNESRPIQLVTHARVRSGTDFDLFTCHAGEPRALMIYDETLLRSDSFAFSFEALRMALACLAIRVERVADPVAALALQYLQASSEAISRALAGLQAPGGDQHHNGAAVDLPSLDPAALQSYRSAIESACRDRRDVVGKLNALLAVSQEPLQALRAEQGAGVVAIRESVPPGLRNVVILDASTPVRELVRLDPTIQVEQSFEPRDLKCFGAVEVHQLMAAGGRGSIERSYAGERRESAAVSLEVADIIRANRQARAFLIFTFLPRAGLEVAGQLRRDLVREGIELEATTPTGQRRFEFLTWGSQEGLNGYEHCDVVILAGVLHRSHLDLAAAIKGQVQHLPEPTPPDCLKRVVESEVAHVVYQAASRGSCRRVIDGRAQAMKLYLIHRSVRLKTVLDRVMPGAVWHCDSPRHLPSAKAEGRASLLFEQLLAHLATLPDELVQISSSAVKKAMGLTSDNATKQAFSAAVQLLDADEHGWSLQARSLVRKEEITTTATTHPAVPTTLDSDLDFVAPNKADPLKMLRSFSLKSLC